MIWLRHHFARLAGGACLVVALGALSLSLVRGDPWAPVVAVALAGLLVLLGRAIAPTELRADFLLLVLTGFAVRIVAAVVIYQLSVARGEPGVVTGDDGGYSHVAAGVAAWLHGRPLQGYSPPDWNGGWFYFGTYLYMVTGIYFLFGPDPLLADFANGMLAVAAALFAWDLARRTFGPRSATATAAILMFFPSLVFFSSINVKDSLVIFLTVFVLWLVARFREKPSLLRIVPIFLCTIPLQSLRLYAYEGVVICALIGVLVAHESGRMRLLHGVAALVLAASVITLTSVVSGYSPVPTRVLYELERVRIAMAAGRTAFGNPQDIAPAPVVTPSLAPGPTGQPTSGPIAVPTTGRDPYGVAENPPALQGEDAVVVTRTISYLPYGLMFALFAPFPWASADPRDLVTVPEMLLWYVMLLAAVFTIWRAHSLWRAFVPWTVFAIGTLLLFSLVEGNLGTLYRHRIATDLPMAALLAGPSLVRVARALSIKQHLRTGSAPNERRSDSYP